MMQRNISRLDITEIKRTVLTLFAVLTMTLTGCGTTSMVMDQINASEVKPYAVVIEYKVSVADDWKYLFESKLKTELAAAGVQADKDDNSVNSAEISFVTFRLRDDGTRLMAGILAGTDEVTSEITARDASGAVIGKGVVTTSNATAWGTNDGYLKEHAKDIVKFLLGEP